MNRNLLPQSIAACAALALVAGLPASAELKCQLGLLTPETLAVKNPATGMPWKAGDQYRFAFHTSGDTTASSTDIEFYNALVQNLANASTAYKIGAADGVTWKVIGSTSAVDARDNTSTNPNVNGTGHAIFLLDGSTLVAKDYAELWSGSLQHIINITEKGEERAWWPFTGTLSDGTKRTGGSVVREPLGGTFLVGQGNASSTTQWMYRTNTGRPPSELLPLYALSDPLALVDGAPFQLTITPAAEPATGYVLEWDSQVRKLYNLRTSTDLSAPISAWELVEGGIAATPPANTYPIDPSGPRRFYAVERYDAPPPPPLLSSGFEGGDGGFTVFTPQGSAWQHGTPLSEGPGGVVNQGNAASARCWGTNIGNPGYYLNPTDTRLRSPVIDLTQAHGAVLTFAEALDLENADTAVVNLIEADTDTVIATVYTAKDTVPNEAAWAAVPAINLGAGAGRQVRIEWRLTGTGGGTADYMGWYIDDVRVLETFP